MQAGRAAPDGGAAYFNDLFARCGALMQLIPVLPQPVIAEVQGIATAAGCQLVASCDMAIAAEGTRFGVNGVNIGLFCSTPMVALTRNIGRKAAFELLTTGQFIDAARASRAAGHAGSGNAAPGPDHRRETVGGGQDRQARLLRTSADGPRAGLRPYRPGDGRQYAAARYQ